MQSTSWETLDWKKHKLESRLPGEICRWYHPYGRKWRGTKKPLESERGEWKSWLKAQHSENEDHGIWSHHFMWNRWGNSGKSVRFIFWAPKSLQMVIAAMKLKDLLLGRKVSQPRRRVKKQRHYFAKKGPSNQGYGFSCGYVWMWELDCDENWASMN